MLYIFLCNILKVEQHILVIVPCQYTLIDLISFVWHMAFQVFDDKVV